ncbi:MAG: hypothetical protein AB7Q81_17135 [Gammaproteobacteria bacterium]
MDLLDLLFDWHAALAYGTDVVAYLVMALVGTTFFVLRLVFALFFGGDADFDPGLHDAASDSTFGFFSLLSILAFFMGAGWMGLTCRIDWELSSLASAASAAGFGLVTMSLASGLMMFARRLGRTIEYDLQTAVGRTARVYLTVPKKGDGRGQVEVDVSGRRKVLDAVSSGGRLPQFTSVRVEAVRDDGTLVVAPLDS